MKTPTRRFPPTQADPVPHRVMDGPDRYLGRLHLRIRDDQVAVLTFDHPDSSANILDQTTLEELDTHLKEVEEHPGLRGLVVTSSKPAIFVAGADVNALQNLSETELEKYLELGQNVFNRLADLKIATVAAIHGACMGGGMEVALACDWRVASSDDSTKIGLPETQLGILPAWGGSTRLPRLIGVPKALGLILPGKQLNGTKAKRSGVVDAVVNPAHLMEEALRLLKRGKRKDAFHPANLPPATAAVRAITKRKLLQETRGNYPAALQALEVVTRAGSGSVSDSLARERKAVMSLAAEPATKNLIRLFLLQQKARKLKMDASVTPLPAEVRCMAVIGAGIMGAGIAQWVSSRGKSVILKDIGEKPLAAGLARIRKLYADGAKRGLFSRHDAERHQDLIVPAVEPGSMKHLDLVIEAAVEDLEMKKKIFRDLAERTSPHTILATNTSALPVGELAADPEVMHPERVLGLHFFNPVHRMKLVEVVVTSRTAPEYIEGALRFVTSIGKLPVVVKDSPGFLVNRILMPYLIEAGRLFDEGVDAREIDEALLDFGMPMGPLRLLDEVGLDVARHVAATMEDAFEERMAVPPILNRMMEAGMLGRKSGRGFYLHDEGHRKSASPVLNEAALEMRSRPEPRPMTRRQIADLLTLLMVDESARCLEEGITAEAADVDFAMVMGTGWAPFRGGPLRYADSLGFPDLMDRYRFAQEATGHFFVPSDTLNRMARTSRGFYPADR